MASNAKWAKECLLLLISSTFLSLGASSELLRGSKWQLEIQSSAGAYTLGRSDLFFLNSNMHRGFHPGQKIMGCSNVESDIVNPN